jgi:hypothetical protein
MPAERRGSRVAGAALAIALLASLALLACGPREEGPIAPADPITTPGEQPTGPLDQRPGVGPASFVGRWAADPSWCLNMSGAEQPITITPLRFQGYENGCDIAEVAEITDGYEAQLACTAEGEQRSERVRMQVVGQTLRLTYLDRGAPTVVLTKCTTLSETPRP